MKEFRKTGLVILSLCIVLIVLCSCGSVSDKNFGSKENNVYYDEALEDLQDSQAKNNSQSMGTPEQITQDRKIIEYITFTVETKTFDKLMNDINDTVKQSGGYIENSEIGGNSYYNSDNRTAELVIRIPKAKQYDFSDFLSENCNVVNRSVSTKDVTDQYIDTQSRIKALTLEKETLEKLLTQSSNISDTLTVYERLTNVIAEIESYQGKLNQMDNLIEYTTFTVYINEVEKERKVQNQNWFMKTRNDLLDNLSDVGNGLLVFLSFVISALPYWIMLGVLIVVTVFIIRRVKKKKAKKM